MVAPVPNGNKREPLAGHERYPHRIPGSGRISGPAAHGRRGNRRRRPDPGARPVRSSLLSPLSGLVRCLITALGAGNVIGSLRRSRQEASIRHAASALCILSVAMMVFVMAHWIWLSVVAAATAGVACLLAGATLRTLLLRHAGGVERQAAVMAAWALAWAGSKHCTVHLRSPSWLPAWNAHHRDPAGPARTGARTRAGWVPEGWEASRPSHGFPLNTLTRGVHKDTSRQELTSVSAGGTS